MTSKDTVAHAIQVALGEHGVDPSIAEAVATSFAQSGTGQYIREGSEDGRRIVFLRAEPSRVAATYLSPLGVAGCAIGAWTSVLGAKSSDRASLLLALAAVAAMIALLQSSVRLTSGSALVFWLIYRRGGVSCQRSMIAADFDDEAPRYGVSPQAFSSAVETLTMLGCIQDEAGELYIVDWVHLG